jgi:hypothetical protein
MKPCNYTTLVYIMHDGRMHIFRSKMDENVVHIDILSCHLCVRGTYVASCVSCPFSFHCSTGHHLNGAFSKFEHDVDDIKRPPTHTRTTAGTTEASTYRGRYAVQSWSSMPRAIHKLSRTYTHTRFKIVVIEGDFCKV